MSKGNGCLGFFVMFAVGILLVWTPIKNNISFDINCGDYLKRAADAPTVEMAKPELDIAIKYFEENHLTTGMTHIWIPSPSCDLKFMYAKLIAARADLETVTDNSSPLERSNILMKLRETLLDNGSEGTVVTLPSHIAQYPVPGIMTTMMIIGAFFIVIGLLGLLAFLLS